METIKLIPLIDACDLPSEVEDWCNIHDITTHYQDSIAYIEWDNEDDEVFCTWLLKQYGEDIQNYNMFAINAT